MERRQGIPIAVVFGALFVPAGLLNNPASGQCLTGNCLSGEVLADSANRIYTGENAGDGMGIAVAGIGNILGFGNHEAVILSDNFNGPPTPGDSSKMYVVDKSALDPFWYAQEHFGFADSVELAGDVDGDGTNDWIVGGPITTVYSGATGLDIVSFTEEAAGDMFGNSVTGVGDIDGNGFDDVAVGAPLNTAGTGDDPFIFNQAGRVYVFLTPDGGYAGAPSIPADQADIIFTGNPSDRLGYDIASGDISGDGIPDLLMTAFYAKNNHRDPNQSTVWRGKAYVFYMRSDLLTPIEFGAGRFDDLDDEVNIVIMHNTLNFFSAFSAAVGGDFDGGGRADFMIGSYRWKDANGVMAGRVHLFYGEDLPASCACGTTIVLDLEADARVLITGQQDGPPQGGGDGSISFGYDVAFAGDVDGDGFDDIIVGAPYYDIGFGPDIIDVGAAYLFCGTNSYTTQTHLLAEDDSAIEFEGMVDGDLFGFSVDSHGFANRPLNKEDVIIGAPGVDNGANVNAGRVYVFFPCAEIDVGGP